MVLKYSHCHLRIGISHLMTRFFKLFYLAYYCLIFRTACMVPKCDGMIKYETIKGGIMATWVRQNNSVERYKIVKESIAKLSKYYNLNPKTIVKWRKRSFTKDADMGQKHPRSTVLTLEEEAVIVAFRKHTLLLLDDCLYALQSTIPHF